MKRVTIQNPCPICGKPDWCGMSDDGCLVVCMREPKGSIGTAKNGGYIHLLKSHDLPERRYETRTIQLNSRVRSDFKYQKLNGILRNALIDSKLHVISKQLDLSIESLDRLQVGWCNCLKVWSFPMFDVEGQITGFRLRTPVGKKFSMTGGKEGLFIPANLCFDHRRLFICEGPTDTAAMLDLGFDAIGRPSCMGAVKMTTEFVRQNWPLDVIIVADGDIPGKRGALILSNVLMGTARTVRIITPPNGIKDVREWKRQGVIAADILNLANQTNPIKFEIGVSAWQK